MSGGFSSHVWLSLFCWGGIPSDTPTVCNGKYGTWPWPRQNFHWISMIGWMLPAQHPSGSQESRVSTTWIWLVDMATSCSMTFLFWWPAVKVSTFPNKRQAKSCFKWDGELFPVHFQNYQLKDHCIHVLWFTICTFLSDPSFPPARFYLARIEFGIGQEMSTTVSPWSNDKSWQSCCK